MTTAVRLAKMGYSISNNILLTNEADISVKESPLIAAIRNKHLECIISLLISGADVKVVSTGGETALSIACKMRKIHTVELLLEHGNKNLCPTSIISIFSDQRMDLNILQLLMHYGAKNNLTEVIDSVFQHSLVNVNDIWNGSTALYTAAENGSVEIMDKLISHGANMDGKNYKGEIISSALCASCQNGHYAAVDYLLKAGAKVNIIDNKGRTPLFYAAASRNIDILKLLFKQRSFSECTRCFWLERSGIWLQYYKWSGLFRCSELLAAKWFTCGRYTLSELLGHGC